MSQRTIEYKEGGVLMNLNKKRRVDIFENTMAHMTYVEIEQAAKEGEIVLFPIAVIEEHGPHLPLAVDVYGAYLQSRRVKAELKKKKIKSLIAPPFIGESILRQGLLEAHLLAGRRRSFLCFGMPCRV